VLLGEALDDPAQHGPARSPGFTIIVTVGPVPQAEGPIITVGPSREHDPTNSIPAPPHEPRRGA
jgi:hypothetical protein